MDEGFLSLKWNNHKAAFFTVLRVLREKRSYTDVTIACDNKFFDVHKIVLMACSEYFSELFEHTRCINPVIVLKDVTSSDLEALLDYMYLGEVDVQQKTLPGVIKAAECLKIKGLAAPDDGDGGGTAKTTGNSSECEKPSNKRRRIDRDNDKNSPAPMPPSRVRRCSQVSEGNHISRNLMYKVVDLRKDVPQMPLSSGNEERVPHLHCTTEMVTSPQYTGHEDHDARYDKMPPPPQDSYHSPNHTNRTGDISPGAEAFQPIMEIKTEQSEVELENDTLKHESSEGHEDSQQHHKDSGGVSDLSHFLTAAMEETVVPPHLFSGVQQAGPSEMHRQGAAESGTDSKMSSDSFCDVTDSDSLQTSSEAPESESKSKRKYKVSLDDVLHFLKTGRQAPPRFVNLDKATKKKRLHSLSEFSRNFVYEDNTLFYQPKRGKKAEKKPSKVKVLFTREDIEHVLSDIHGNGTNGSHMGEKRTQTNISERFYWRTITEDVRHWIANCPECQKVQKTKTMISVCTGQLAATWSMPTYSSRQEPVTASQITVQDAASLPTSCNTLWKTAPKTVMQANNTTYTQ